MKSFGLEYHQTAQKDATIVKPSPNPVKEGNPNNILSSPRARSRCHLLSCHNFLAFVAARDDRSFARIPEGVGKRGREVKTSRRERENREIKCFAINRGRASHMISTQKLTTWHELNPTWQQKKGQGRVMAKMFLYSRIKVMRKRPEKGWDGQECECEILGFSNAEVACEHCGTKLGVNPALRREK